MQSSNALRWSARTALALLMTSLIAGCSPPAPIVSGDTYCEKAKFISSNPDQKKVFKSDEPFWRSFVEPVVNHNDTYVMNCVIPDLIKEEDK